MEDGLHIDFHPNGQKMIEANVKNGQLDGKCTSWHLNEQLRGEEFYKNGIRVGKFTEWHPTGFKDREGFLDDEGLYQGKLTIWFEDGQISEEDYFVDDVQNGLLKKWDEKGNTYYSLVINAPLTPFASPIISESAQVTLANCFPKKILYIRFCVVPVLRF